MEQKQNVVDARSTQNTLNYFPILVLKEHKKLCGDARNRTGVGTDLRDHNVT